MKPTRTKTVTPYFLALFLVVFSVVTAACSSPTPTSTPEVVIPECAVIVGNGEGWNSILGRLGVDPYGDVRPDVLVNGYRQNPSGVTTEGDVVVLVDKPAQCSGTYIAAVAQKVNTAHEVVVGGFKTAIDRSDLETALADVCRAVRWYELDKLGFDGNIVTGGCNFTTIVKTSRDDGSNTCSVYNSAAEAFDATSGFELNRIKSMAVGMTSKSLSTDEVYAQYCK